MPQTARDAALEVTRALPNGAATVTSTSLQVKADASKDFVADTELEIAAPAVTTAMLGDAATLKYSIVEGNAADLSDATVLAGDVLVQTGAGGAGAAAATKRFRLPSTVKKYVGLRAVKSAAGDATGVLAVLRFLF
jgi:hypothetical protein